MDRIDTFGPMSNNKVTIENVRTGARKVISTASWDLMKNPSNQGDVRKGYRLLSAVDAPKAVATKKPSAPTFIPPEVEEAQRKKAEADAARDAAMISGAPAPEPEAPAAPEAAPEPAPQPTGDDLSKLTGITVKVREVLASIGITTFAQLAAANASDINKALASANLAAKAAQVPGWKTKAAELAKA